MCVYMCVCIRTHTGVRGCLRRCRGPCLSVGCHDLSGGKCVEGKVLDVKSVCEKTRGLRQVLGLSGEMLRLKKVLTFLRMW